MIHEMKLKPIVRPVIHPSGMVVCLPTGLKEFVCSCGGRYTLPSLELPHKTVPGREHLIVVRPTCS